MTCRTSGLVRAATFALALGWALLGLCQPGFAFYNLQDYAHDRAAARTDAKARAVLDARIDGVASGLFTANGLHADGLYREGSFCLAYNVTLGLQDFYAMLDARLAEYRRDGMFDQVEGQSIAATLAFELRRRYPCGRDRGDPFPAGYVFPDGTPATAYRMTPPAPPITPPPVSIMPQRAQAPR
jgi:hypothetical protein